MRVLVAGSFAGLAGCIRHRFARPRRLVRQVEPAGCHFPASSWLLETLSYLWLRNAGLLEISQAWVAGFKGSITVSRMGMHILPQVEPSLVLVLIEGGTSAPLAWSGTLRVVQIAAANKPAHRYQKVKEDRQLAGMGVMPKQAEQWMRLVVGERGAGSKTPVPDGVEKASGLATWLGQVRAA